MDKYNASEQAYKNGYSAGYEAGRRSVGRKSGHCDWCKPGEELCGTCKKFFDYHGDGGSDKCSSDCNSDKCYYYKPIGFCPNCGADMRGEEDG